MNDDAPVQKALEIRLDTEIYPVEAVRRAAYDFTDRCTIYLEPIAGALVAHLTPTVSCDPQELRGQFLNSALDHSLRRSIAMETDEVRRQIVSAALRQAYGVDE